MSKKPSQPEVKPTPRAEVALTRSMPTALAARFDWLSGGAYPFASGSTLQRVAKDKQNADQSLLAVISQHHLPPRLELAQVVSNWSFPCLLPLIDFDLVTVLPDQPMQWVFIYQQPAGRPIVSQQNPRFEPWSDEQIREQFIRPIIPLLQALEDKHMSCRGFRLDNLFFDPLGKQPIVQVGDFVASLPAHDQPSIYETIPSAMASPAGRGAGSVEDDLYAIGVCALSLALGYVPFDDKPEVNVLDLKIEKSSFAALVGQNRFRKSFTELLHGLLNDHDEDRWTVKDLEKWSIGRMPSARRERASTSPQRGFTLFGETYFSPRDLARGIAHHWSSPKEEFSFDDLVAWVRRQGGQEQLARKLEDFQGEHGTKEGIKRLSTDMITRLAAVLDPEAPLRYRDLSMMPQGLAGMLAAYQNDPEAKTMLLELISKRLYADWMGEKITRAVDKDQHAASEHPFNGEMRILSYLPSLVDRPILGHGYERCLYELNNMQHCLSPIVGKHKVQSIRELVEALENILPQRDTSFNPIDRHIAAFAATCTSNITSKMLMLLSDTQSSIHRDLGLCQVLAAMQSAAGANDAAPHMVNAAQARLEKLIPQLYRSHSRREDMAKQLRLHAKSNNIRKMVDAIDQPILREQDARAFAWAQKQYQDTTFKLQKLEEMRGLRFELAKQIGGRYAGMAAMVLMMSWVMYQLWDYLSWRLM